MNTTSWLEGKLESFTKDLRIRGCNTNYSRHNGRMNTTSELEKFLCIPQRSIRQRKYTWNHADPVIPVGLTNVTAPTYHTRLHIYIYLQSTLHITWQMILTAHFGSGGVLSWRFGPHMILMNRKYKSHKSRIESRVEVLSRGLITNSSTRRLPAHSESSRTSILQKHPKDLVQ